MLELGEESEAEHSKVVKQLEGMKLDKTILVGPIFCDLQLDNNVFCFQNSLEAKNWILENSLEGYLVLLKGSRGIKLETIAEVL